MNDLVVSPPRDTLKRTLSKGSWRGHSTRSCRVDDIDPEWTRARRYGGKIVPEVADADQAPV